MKKVDPRAPRTQAIRRAPNVHNGARRFSKAGGTMAVKEVLSIVCAPNMQMKAIAPRRLSKAGNTTVAKEAIGSNDAKNAFETKGCAKNASETQDAKRVFESKSAKMKPRGPSSKASDTNVAKHANCPGRQRIEVKPREPTTKVIQRGAKYKLTVPDHWRKQVTRMSQGSNIFQRHPRRK